MLRPWALWLLGLAALRACADDTTDYVTFTESLSTVSPVTTADFTGSEYTYLTYEGQSTVTSTSTVPENSTSSATSSTGSGSESGSGSSQITATSSTSHSVFVVGGNTVTSTVNVTNATASSTTSSATPTNTVPCNNYPEFCTRKYSNITEVCAHNSAFVVKGNAASNQALPIEDQLNDGVRMLQGETHYVNGTVMSCHTSCDLLNAGTWQDELETLVGWLESHPYDVVTFLVVNSDFQNIDVYVPAIQNSGIAPYLYVPKYIPQHRDQWPTLGEMILSGKRAVMFMDYNANQTAVPYVLDQFSHMFETPFSPTNRSFPCTAQRPPGLKREDAEKNLMYLANHNLNIAVDISALTGIASSESILIPNSVEVNVTNGEYDQLGQLGAMSSNCTSDWNRPPNFLLVDYYNIGVPGPGSVFEVAARANNVTYNRQCCGLNSSPAPIVQASFGALAVAMTVAFLLVWS